MDRIQIKTACAFLYKDGKVLIAKRAKTKKFLPDRWELPGGHVEPEETIENALTREIREEFHIDIELTKPLAFYTFTYNLEGDEVIQYQYFVHMKDISQSIIINKEDHSEYKWISKEEVDDYFDDNDAEKIAIKKGYMLLNV